MEMSVPVLIISILLFLCCFWNRFLVEYAASHVLDYGHYLSRNFYSYY